MALTVFTYHSRKKLDPETTMKIMNKIGIMINESDNKMRVGGARNITKKQEKDFWDFYNKLINLNK